MEFRIQNLTKMIEIQGFTFTLKTTFDRFQLRLV